jgi:hypothetical protein
MIFSPHDPHPPLLLSRAAFVDVVCHMYVFLQMWKQERPCPTLFPSPTTTTTVLLNRNAWTMPSVVLSLWYISSSLEMFQISTKNIFDTHIHLYIIHAYTDSLFCAQLIFWWKSKFFSFLFLHQTFYAQHTLLAIIEEDFCHVSKKSLIDFFFFCQRCTQLRTHNFIIFSFIFERMTTHFLLMDWSRYVRNAVVVSIRSIYSLCNKYTVGFLQNDVIIWLQFW